MSDIKIGIMGFSDKEHYGQAMCVFLIDFPHSRPCRLARALAASVAIATALIRPLSAQQPAQGDYIQLYNRGEFRASYDSVRANLAQVYEKRNEDTRVPTDFISSKKLESAVRINDLFRNRIVKAFFIEDNSQLFTSHLYAARCCYRLDEFDASLNHYAQALRFKKLEFEKDDTVFYEMAKVFEKINNAPAYVRMLEAAYSMNAANYEYSREIALALYRTPEKKKAIYHLTRYLDSRGDDVDDPGLYLMLGNLYEDINRYLDTVHCYKKYCALKPEDGFARFALGYLSFSKTGDYALAEENLNAALSLLPEEDVFRRSKAYEYRADMAMSNLEFPFAVSLYLETIRFQDAVKNQINKKKEDVAGLKGAISDVKQSLIKNPDYATFNEYEYLQEEKGRHEYQLREVRYQYDKLNAGRVRWNLAACYEKLESFDDAIRYYREAIAFNYNAGGARDRIVKLQLKIKRGY